MISRDDVAKLAELSLVAVEEKELKTLAGEMDSILDYVSEIDKLAGEEPGTRERAVVHNVMRDDVVTNTPGEYTKQILENMPDRDGDSLRVKKIL